MLFKSFNMDSVLSPTGFCPGVNCGPYTCNEPSADAKSTQKISVEENKASSQKPSPTT